MLPDFTSPEQNALTTQTSQVALELVLFDADIKEFLMTDKPKIHPYCRNFYENGE